MRLPGYQNAKVPRAKIVEYLLSAVHPSGRTKARWFVQFGFRLENWVLLAEALKRHAAACDVASIEVSPFGKRYVVDGELASPDGRNPRIRSIWFIEEGESVPRFVTAFPA